MGVEDAQVGRGASTGQVNGSRENGRGKPYEERRVGSRRRMPSEINKTEGERKLAFSTKIHIPHSIFIPIKQALSQHTFTNSFTRDESDAIHNYRIYDVIA